MPETEELDVTTSADTIAEQDAVIDKELGSEPTEAEERITKAVETLKDGGDELEGTMDLPDEYVPKPETKDDDETVDTAEEADAGGDEVEDEPDDDARVALVKKALTLGLKQSEVAGAGDGLAGLVRILESVSKVPEPESEEKPEPEKVEPEKTAPEGAFKFDAELFAAHDIEPDYFDEGLVKVLNAFAAHLERGVVERGSERSTTSKARDARLDRIEGRAFITDNDRMVGVLGKDYEDLLGKGAFGRLEREGDHRKNRQKVAKRMEAIEMSRRDRGLDFLSDEELFEEAVAQTFAKHREALQAKKIGKRIRKRGRSMTGRPTSREPDKPDMTAEESEEAQKKAAVEAVRAERKERGIEY